MSLPSSIPRAPDTGAFFDEPLGFLRTARTELGDMFVLRDGGPVFSRSSDCVGAVAVFGRERHQAVLNDIESFGMPVSAAERMALPPNLVALNHSLHSMRGERRAAHRRWLGNALDGAAVRRAEAAMGAALEAFERQWQAGQTIDLLAEMRRLALKLSTRFLFGTEYDEAERLALLLQAFFQLRREASSRLNQGGDLREEVVEVGGLADECLQRFARWCRSDAAATSDGLIPQLARARHEPRGGYSGRELAAHTNVLFMSSNEPIAVGLTWTLLILSQLPELRSVLRNEITGASEGRSTLLDPVISESLRLLTPNAMMVRVTTEPVRLGGALLPERTEVVLCPFLAHREPGPFPEPDRFLPSRWRQSAPSTFEYFPFGAGGHSCVGQRLALAVMRTALTALIPRRELVLAGDQEVDWRIHILFMPKDDPLVRVETPGAARSAAGRLQGPVRDLVRLDAFVS